MKTVINSLTSVRAQIAIAIYFSLILAEPSVTAQTMYYSDGDIVVRANLDGTEPSTIIQPETVPEEHYPLYHLAIDGPTSQVFWSNPFGIVRANLDGSGRTTIINNSAEPLCNPNDPYNRPQDVYLTVDSDEGNLYWMRYWDCRPTEIHRATWNGNEHIVLGSIPQDVVLGPPGPIQYVESYGQFVFDSANSAIYMLRNTETHDDGSGVQRTYQVFKTDLTGSNVTPVSELVESSSSRSDNRDFFLMAAAPAGDALFLLGFSGSSARLFRLDLDDSAAPFEDMASVPGFNHTDMAVGQGKVYVSSYLDGVREYDLAKGIWEDFVIDHLSNFPYSVDVSRTDGLVCWLNNSGDSPQWATAQFQVTCADAERVWVRDVVASDTSSITALAVDGQNGWAYWLMTRIDAGDKVQRGRLDGSSWREDVTAYRVGEAIDLAIDSDRGTVVWTTDCWRGCEPNQAELRIEYANHEMGGAVLATSDLGSYGAICSDELNDRVFWSRSAPLHNILLIDLEDEVIEETLSGSASSLAYDDIRNVLFRAGSWRIIKQDLITRESELVLNGLQCDELAIDPIRERLYWLDWYGLWRSNYEGESIEWLVPGSWSSFALDIPRPGDCVRDGQLSLLDGLAVSDCIGGPGAIVASSCLCASLDSDDDVDLIDWASFQNAFQTE